MMPLFNQPRSKLQGTGTSRSKCLALTVAILAALTPITSTVADYLWPLPFGNELTSIFGDYRTRRYHVGIDIRTGGEIGKTVVAPMDGYIMRLRTGYYGYGKAIYFKMADNNVAVFGHLSAFAPEVEEYIAGRQIEKEDYNLEIDLDPARFPFKQGQTIAFSGATGVGAPHLHFEVRTPENVPTNPLTYDGLHVDDKVSPIFRNLRLVGFDNEELALALGWDVGHPFVKSAKGNEYTIRAALPCGIGNYWIAAEIVDKVGKSSWDKPLYQLEVRTLDSAIYRLRYDAISYDDTYLIGAQRNFQQAVRGSQEYYNLMDVGTTKRHDCICEMLGNHELPVEIVATDVAGNSSRAVVTFYDAVADARPRNAMIVKPDTARLAGLIRKYSIGSRGAVSAAMIPARSKLYLLARIVALPSSIVEVKSPDGAAVAPMKRLTGNFYLATIDSLQSSGEMLAADTIAIQITPAAGEPTYAQFAVSYNRTFKSVSSATTLYSEDNKFSVSFPPLNESMFPLDQSLYFKIESSGAGRFKQYQIEPNELAMVKQVSYHYLLGDAVPKGIGLYAPNGSGLLYLGSEIDSVTRSVTAKSYSLGTVTARCDTIPPGVRRARPVGGAVVSLARPTITFAFSDDLSGVSDDIDILVDGRWCIPVYDPETGQVSAIPHFDLGLGKHQLEITVRDKAGNQRKISTSFSRASTKKK